MVLVLFCGFFCRGYMAPRSQFKNGTMDALSDAQASTGPSDDLSAAVDSLFEKNQEPPQKSLPEVATQPASTGSFDVKNFM